MSPLLASWRDLEQELSQSETWKDGSHNGNSCDVGTGLNRGRKAVGTDSEGRRDYQSDIIREDGFVEASRARGQGCAADKCCRSRLSCVGG